MKRWLITGGCGFIGIALIRRLLHESGYLIRIVDNLSVGSRENLKEVTKFTEPSQAGPDNWSGVQLFPGDILDEKLALQTVQGADAVVHLAANTGVPVSVEFPREDMQTNIVGTFNYLEAARAASCTKFIFASSGATVGECVPPVNEELPSRPVSPYGASKLGGEGYCSAYYHSYGLQTVALRFGNVYGPGSSHKSSVVAAFLRRAREKLPLIIYGDGAQTRDFIYIHDIISAILAAAHAPDIGGQIFQIATNREHTVLELTNMLVEILDRDGFGPIGVIHEKTRPGEVTRNFSDTSKAAHILGWRPQYELRSGLENTVAWFKTWCLAMDSKTSSNGKDT
ncbi:MAG: GDP-mannose 4,6-dehydratase [Deltaproteobacteria bacterium]|nr:GDP-mannose 4,6-dehydratase [Deltaproteobacteria bacterium]